jgi:hypothetical protein
VSSAAAAAAAAAASCMDVCVAALVCMLVTAESKYWQTVSMCNIELAMLAA